ncbi:MAG TPA: hypothetical protein VEX38_02400, partial [Fimbriimonadaceae bacterium]|nr:hypothetical protein [Fimbriimonadaceae bacterium]
MDRRLVELGRGLSVPRDMGRSTFLTLISIVGLLLGVAVSKLVDASEPSAIALIITSSSVAGFIGGWSLWSIIPRRTSG